MAKNRGDLTGKGKKGKTLDVGVEDYRHSSFKRKNNPPAKIAAEGKVPALPKITYSYNPRLAPTLRFDAKGKADQLPELLETARQRPLTDEEARTLADALRNREPWLEWSGKRESKGFSVDPVALHIHERISAQAILKVASRQDVQRSLFADPQQDYHQAVQFYKHDIDWTNRMILGDSLQVMASLAHREDLAGKVQMIFMDPPYGIKFGSNFQSEVGKRDVKDKDQDLTREPEMVKAYRDTWHLGIHSYLTYMRDRLIVAKELLADSGSIFIQISDENIHRIRTLLDEIYGVENFVSEIAFQTTSGFADASGLSRMGDYLLWYAKDRKQLKYRPLYEPQPLTLGEGNAKWVYLPDRTYRGVNAAEKKGEALVPQGGRLYNPDNMQSQGAASTPQPYTFEGRAYLPGNNNHWKPNYPKGLDRLAEAERIHVAENSLRYRRYADDFPFQARGNIWTDTLTGSFTETKHYVVQTNPKVVERCILMTTDPGDLVLDPTCGSGTTAFAAEQWGRRWITLDTSRVALAIARQRLMTSKFDYWELRDEEAGVKGGFIYETAPHITLKSIANNVDLDPIFEKHESILQKHLDACNKALAKIDTSLRQQLKTKLALKQKDEGKKAVTAGDELRWNLPGTFEHWTVPFETDPDYPPDLIKAIEAYRAAWIAKMEEVNACIAVNAEQEELVDQPVPRKGVVRVSGPFSVEAVQPPEVSLDDPATTTPIDGAPDELEDAFEFSGDGEVEAKNAEAYLDQMLRLLKMDGVVFPNNKQMKFSRLDSLSGASLLHAEGRWVQDGTKDDDADGEATVSVAFGPQYGPVTAALVEQLIRQASRKGYDDLVIAGFNFDGAAQAVIEEAQHPDLRIHMAHVRPDVNPGMNGLLKEQPRSQLFTVFGQPRTRLTEPDAEGSVTVIMEGVDIYNPVENSVTPTKADKVAAWFVDGDYDGRTFCITQAFFPDKTAWKKLSKALKGVVDSDAFEALSGTKSLSFPLGKNKTVAVKVIDPRGNEVMRVHRVGA